MEERPPRQELEDLSREIDECTALLRSARSRKNHFLLDQVLVRYLWGATANARALLAAAEAPVHPIGAGPLLRSIFEAYADLVYLFCGHGDYAPDATDDEKAGAWEDAARRILIWDVLQWSREWELHSEAVEADPSLAAAGTQRESVEQAFASICKQCHDIGVDTTLLEQLFEEERTKQRRNWHWSGLGFRARLEAINRWIERGTPTEVSAAKGFVQMLQAMWPPLSDTAHPPPGWKLLEIRHDPNGTIEAPDPAQGETEEANVLASQAQELLGMIRKIVTNALSQQ